MTDASLSAALSAAVEALEQTWRSTAALCHDLTDEEWAKPTGCPGWTVQDQLSHLVGLERVLMGDSHPDDPVPDAPHIRDEVGRWMEAHVAQRRGRHPNDVLAEFEAMINERVPQLRSLAEKGDPEAEMTGPMGFPAKAGSMIGIRVLDSWVHEQDIRRAVGKPGGYEGGAASISLDRFVSGLGFVIGKKVAPPDGTAVTFIVDGPVARTLTVSVNDGRAEVSQDEVTPVAQAILRMSTDTFVGLMAGREGAADGVTIDGDEDLGRRIVENMAVTP